MYTIHLFHLSLLFSHSIAFSLDTKNIWGAFSSRYGKIYPDIEVQGKLESFSHTAFSVVKHNIEADLEQHPFWTGLNQWSAMSPEQRQKRHGCVIPEDGTESTEVPLFNRTGIHDVPKNFDNRKLGLVTRVKHQGSCNACWAFAAVGAMEGQWAKYQCQLIELSEQNSVDCAKDFGKGCNGGLPYSAYWDSMRRGLNSEKDYPYTGEVQKCKFKAEKRVYVSRGYFNVPYNDEVALRDAVYHVGPITFLFYASRSDFEGYTHGIYDPKGECGTVYDHAMSLVGYGYDDKSRKPYWIVKNSWDTNWGEKGFAKLIRGRNICFIGRKPSFPVV